MYIVRYSIFLLYVTSYASVSDALSHVRSARSTDDEVGEPLFLTPLVDNGTLSEAKNRSRVPPLLDRIESYAGFLTVNRTAGSHLHFWFIPRTVNDGQTVPLILCLRETNVLFAQFYENGPFQLTGGELRKREYAWTNNYHMLYIDTLIGIGYSFTERGGYVTSHFDVGRYIYEALSQFYKLFPQFRASDLYIIGDAGTFVPAVAHTIHTANQQPDALKMPLKGIAIGNGVPDFEESRTLYAVHLHTVGLIDKRERFTLRVILNNVKYAIRSGNWTRAADENAKLNYEIAKMIGEVSGYDYTRDRSHLIELVQAHTKFVTQNSLRKRIHVGRLKFDSDPSAVANALRENFGRPVKPLVEELVEQYKVLFYNGQHDLSSSLLVNRDFVLRLRWHGAYDFNEAGKAIWRIRSTNSVAGYYSKFENLAFVVVRNAGHMVSFDQPRHALSLINSFTAKQLTTDSTWLGD